MSSILCTMLAEVDRRSELGKVRGMSAFNVWFAEELKKQGITATRLEEKFGIPDSTTSRLKQDAKPSPENVIRIADALGYPVEQLMALAGYPVAPLANLEEAELRWLAVVRAQPWLPDVNDQLAGLPLEQQQVVIGLVEMLHQKRQQRS